ncbi:sugar ABC transporter substrate-binding protein [Brevibacillus centrosporus]|uniref:ABC transporter substrate-binding protein n=1 Tax=Brevibacillus centrosporus TaxID=54910 RepID=UPI002E1ED2C9|nr:sugar ABC transporter substrate-binding protein [Brevibacillus centrosporus]
MKVSKWFSAVLSLALSVGLVAGCSKSASNTPAASSAWRQWSSWADRYTEDGGEYHESTENGAAQGIAGTVRGEKSWHQGRFDFPPFEGVDQKITQMLMAKEKLDVLEVREFNAKQFSMNGFIENLKPYTDKWKNYDQLTDIAKRRATWVDNTPYYIPNGLYQRVLFYRTDWLKEAGLEVPKTWDELLAAGKKLTDPAKNRYGYSFRGGPTGWDYALITIWAYNGKEVDPASAFFLKDGRTVFATPESLQAMNFYKQLYKEASPADSVSWGFQEMVQGFVSGSTAMLIQDPDVIDGAKEKMKEGTWATAPLPIGPSGVAQQVVGGPGWGMTAYSKLKDEAWKLIEFLSDPEQSTTYAKRTSVIPVVKSAAEDEFYKTGYFKAFIDMNAQADVFIDVSRPVDYKGWGAWQSAADKDIQSYLLDKITAEDLLKKWDEYWTKEKAERK